MRNKIENINDFLELLKDLDNTNLTRKEESEIFRKITHFDFKHTDDSLNHEVHKSYHYEIYNACRDFIQSFVSRYENKDNHFNTMNIAVLFGSLADTMPYNWFTEGLLETIKDMPTNNQYQ